MQVPALFVFVAHECLNLHVTAAWQMRLADAVSHDIMVVGVL